MSVQVFCSNTVLMKCLVLEEVCLVCLAMRWCKFPQQGWHGGESTCFPTMHPGFNFQTRCHMWVEFGVGSFPCSKRFFSGYSGFPVSSKTNISKFQFNLDYCQALYHEPLAWVIAQALPVSDIKFTLFYIFIAYRTYIITQVTWLTIGGLISCTFSSHWILSLTKSGWMTAWVFKLRSFSCLQTKSAKSWSLKCRTVWTNGFSFGAGCLLLNTIVKCRLDWIYKPVLDYILEVWKGWL